MNASWKWRIVRPLIWNEKLKADDNSKLIWLCCTQTDYSNVTRNIWSIVRVELLDVLLVLWSLTWIWPLAEVLAHGVASFALNLATILISPYQQAEEHETKQYKTDERKKHSIYITFYQRWQNTHTSFIPNRSLYWIFYSNAKCMLHSIFEIFSSISHRLKLAHFWTIWECIKQVEWLINCE